jgi:hypothetical protein
MTTIVTATQNDVGRVVAFVLNDEGDDGLMEPANLSTASITARFDPIDGGETVTVPDLTGTSEGVVAAPLDTVVSSTGVYWLTFKVVGGATYPSDARSRPQLIVTPEA